MRQRAGKAPTKSGGSVRAGGTSSGGMWRFYTDDSPGIKVCLVFSHEQTTPFFSHEPIKIQGDFFNWASPENVSRLAPPKFAWSGPP